MPVCAAPPVTQGFRAVTGGGLRRGIELWFVTGLQRQFQVAQLTVTSEVEIGPPAWLQFFVQTVYRQGEVGTSNNLVRL